MYSHKLISVILILGLLLPSNYGAAHWSYTNPESGPLEWPKLFPTMCAGFMQSPINLVSSASEYLSDLKIVKIYMSSNAVGGQNQITNNGHSVQVTFPPETWYVSFNGLQEDKYEVVQMHFHWGSKNSQGSEHYLNGQAFPLETHIVTYRREFYPNSSIAVGKPMGLAVLGFVHFIDEKIGYQKSQMSLYRNFSGNLNSDLRVGVTKTMEEINMTEILNLLNPNRYYRYFGSLTTPPCTENVMWTVFRDPVPITTDQLNLFRSLPFPPTESKPWMADNYRPVQPLNMPGQLLHRAVYRALGCKPILHTLQYIWFLLFGIWRLFI